MQQGQPAAKFLTVDVVVVVVVVAALQRWFCWPVLMSCAGCFLCQLHLIGELNWCCMRVRHLPMNDNRESMNSKQERAGRGVEAEKEV